MESERHQEPNNRQASQDQEGDGLPRSSFRDPAGRVILLPDRVLRTIAPQATDLLSTILESQTVEDYQEQGHFVSTRVLDEDTQARIQSETRIQQATGQEEIEAIVEHERIPFASYPHEWPAQMLHEAGRLTIELARSLQDEGLGLKDATPTNVMFDGPDPVFIDLLSVEERHPHDPTWLAAAQFERTVLIPLLLHERGSLEPADLLLTHRDGITPSEAYPMLGPIRRLLPPDLNLVTLPTWLGNDGAAEDLDAYEPKRLDDPDKAAYVYASHLDKQAKRLDRLAPDADQADSHWSDYMATSQYDDAALTAKEAFVAEGLERVDPDWVLDVGCNTGHFSQQAAEQGASVVAIDADPAVVAQTWDRARQQELDILPLVVDLARPTPATGWDNDEASSFLARATGRFDFTLMLAVVHHLLVTEGVPLERIIDLADRLTQDAIVIEHVGPEDAMFQRLLKGREDLHADHSAAKFEAALETHFRIEASEQIPDLDRRLYLARPEASR